MSLLPLACAKIVTASMCEDSKGWWRSICDVGSSGHGHLFVAALNLFVCAAGAGLLSFPYGRYGDATKIKAHVKITLLHILFCHLFLFSILHSFIHSFIYLFICLFISYEQ